VKLLVRAVLAVTVAVAGSIATSAPAGATECTPKGCTSSCYLDLESLEYRCF